jgi:hypothetical protein
MWLQDHLPTDVPGIRVSIFGYSSELWQGDSKAGLVDFTKEFLAELRNGRKKENADKVSKDLLLFRN